MFIYPGKREKNERLKKNAFKADPIEIDTKMFKCTVFNCINYLQTTKKSVKTGTVQNDEGAREAAEKKTLSTLDQKYSFKNWLNRSRLKCIATPIDLAFP